MSTAWAWLSVARFPAVSARAWKQLWRSKARTSPSSVTSRCLRMEHLWVVTKSKLRREMERVWCYTMLYPQRKPVANQLWFQFLTVSSRPHVPSCCQPKLKSIVKVITSTNDMIWKEVGCYRPRKRTIVFQCSCPIVQVDPSCCFLWILMTYNESCAVAQQVLDRELLRTDVCSTWNQGGSPFVDVILMI